MPLEQRRRSPYGNQASLFTTSGSAARKFRYEAPAGNIGINIGVAAPMAYFPFSGWKESLFDSVPSLAVEDAEGTLFPSAEGEICRGGCRRNSLSICSNGIFPLQRMEREFLRHPPRPGTGRCRILYRI